jgi:hypothetical protein
MSAPPSYRSAMEKEDAAHRGALGEVFLTIDPKNIDAQTRIPSIMAMATHETLSAAVTGEDSYTTKEGQSFRVSTISGLMSLWEFSYEKKAISLDGKARAEAESVMKLEAIGPQEDSVLAQSVLNEGSKQLTAKDKGKK